MKDCLNDPATCLSGGEQQRLCIAHALLLDLNVFLFDAPRSALDPISCAAIEELILRLKKYCSVLFVTHNLVQACCIADGCAFFGCKMVPES